jgi:hypothetical protein
MINANVNIIIISQPSTGESLELFSTARAQFAHIPHPQDQPYFEYKDQKRLGEP